MAKRKRSNNDLQNITQKTKDRATRTPLPSAYGVCISLLIRYQRSCDSFNDFCDREAPEPRTHIDYVEDFESSKL
jgi:hypothetical protein